MCCSATRKLSLERLEARQLTAGDLFQEFTASVDISHLSGTDLGSGRIKSLSGTDLGSGRVRAVDVVQADALAGQIKIESHDAVFAQFGR